MTVQFRLLGAIEATVDGQPIALGYAQLRCMLAVLLVDANRSVTVDQLIDRVWTEEQLPRQPRRAVQHNIPLLRQALTRVPGVALSRAAAGYQLSVDRDFVDLHRFHMLLAQAHTATADQDDERVAALLEQALTLWQGEPFADLDIDTPWIHTQRAALTAQHDIAQLDLTDMRLRQGQHTVLLADLAAHTAQHPLDERLAGQYMLALYRSSRQAQALEHYHRVHQLLANELGTDPGPSLQQLHRQMLVADPTLAAPAPVTTVTGPSMTPVVLPVPRQLPAPTRLFTGRRMELAHLDQALDYHATVDDTTLISAIDRTSGDDTTTTRPDAATTVVISAISGAGGIGKTALALHWAHQHLDRFPDGQLYVNLRGFTPFGHPTPASEAIRGFLDGLGVDCSTLPAELDAQAARYRSRVAGKRMLIVLDNARDLDQVVPLLPGSPTCAVLITSRPHLTGLAALHSADLLELDVLPEPDARKLLDCHLGPHRLATEPDAVTDLLAICAGLPLALAIVAARAAYHPTFPLAVLADELRDSSGRLAGLNAGDLQVNLRAVLSWSVRTLSQQAADVFALLGIAPGPDIGLSAAARLAALPEGQTRAELEALEHASLVAQHTPGRYRMHDLIRLYAADTAHRSLAEDALQAALRRVLDFYVHTSHAADGILNPHRAPIQLDPAVPGVHPKPLSDVPEALAWFDTEHPVLLAAQQVAASHAWHSTVWQLAWILDTFHGWRGHLRDKLAVWQAAQHAATRLPDATARIVANRFLGYAHAALGNFEDGIGYLRHALTVAVDHDDTDEQAHAHWVLAWAWGRREDDRRALEHATRARDLFRAVGQSVLEANALNAVGWYAARLGEYDTARNQCLAALALLRDQRDPDGEASTLDSLGYIAHCTCHHQVAIGYYQQALALVRTLGNIYSVADILDHLGHPHVALGEYEQACIVWREALRLFRQQGRDNDIVRVQRQLDDCANG